jgi:hypothetical protein
VKTSQCVICYQELFERHQRLIGQDESGKDTSMKPQRLLTLAAVLIWAVGSLIAQHTAFAQPYPFFGYFAIGLCSTVDYDTVAAKALTLKAADLRTALVSGEFLEDIAQRQHVDLDAVKRALLDAHSAEIDQAVNEGLLDAGQAKQLKTMLLNNYPLPAKQPYPYANAYYPIYGLPADLTAYNYQAVKILQAAAKSLDLKCADLVKTMQNNRSLVAITTSRSKQIGVVIDAMIQAYQDGLDQDIKEQLITPAQAKGLRVQLAGQVTSLVNQAGQPILMQMLALPSAGSGNPLPYNMGGLAYPGSNAVSPNAPGTGPLPPASSGAAMPGTTGSAPSAAAGTPAPTAAAK